MANRRHILLVGSRAFAQCATAVLESCEDVETLHTTHVTIELFLSQWRPDCAIINCDDVKQEPLAEIQELSRFRPKITIVLVNSRHVSQLAASAVSAILFPSEMHPMLAPLVTSLLKKASHCSA